MLSVYFTEAISQRTMAFPDLSFGAGIEAQSKSEGCEERAKTQKGGGPGFRSWPHHNEKRNQAGV